jgi:hypothetical protein
LRAAIIRLPPLFIATFLKVAASAMRTIPVLRVTLLLLLFSSAASSDDSRRFFDFTPVAPDNPVVATIDDIRIPLSELRGYRDAERLNTITDPSDLSQKRAVLDGLINEYLYVDEAHRTGVVQSPEFLRQMEATRTMILTDFMSTRAADEYAGKFPTLTNGGAGLEMAERLFEAASIAVSNEAYAILKRAAQAVDATIVASKRGPVVDSPQTLTAKLHAIVNETPDAVLVEYEHKTISLRHILALYAGLPEPRPAIETPDGLTQIIKPLILPELMAIEAMKRGIAEDTEFKNKVIQNRNALLRFHAHGLIERESSELMQSPTIESTLRAWYEAHKTEYGVLDDAGRNKIPSYEEARSRVEGDYSVALRDSLLAEKAQALRKNRSITIDDDVLRNL